MKNKRFAIILSGCGVFDGSEIQEAVACMLAIDQRGSSYECFAPDIWQYHVINHLTGEESTEKRNVLIESARIARGKVTRLDDFDPARFDALVLPGGFGVAKNLCTFAIDGPDCLVNPEAEKALLLAHKSGLPIGALCISPALVAKVLRDIQLTIGSDESTAAAIESMGAKHHTSHGDEIVIDRKNRLVTSPCYMHDTSISVVARGAANVIDALYDLM
ncbi:isoprenoid biosynthesis glyoxalase ElbB [Roseimarinus sediminis]|uniref:isoprenoid biosynthesis glyoxalase ElbB n=1 Tax=Roseimarinus sediminis TaxID=1610899 RepID=UPI003D23FC78